MSLDVDACIDQISGYIELSDYHDWIHTLYYKTGKQFGYKLGYVTNEKLFDIETEKSLVWNDLFIHNDWKFNLVETIEKETGEVHYKVKVSGNPPAKYYGGENVSNISLNQLEGILKDFEHTYELPLDKIKLTAPFEVSKTIKLNTVIDERLIIFQMNRPYEPMYNSDNELLGYNAKIENNHCYPKIYYPSKKFRKHLDSIRIEKHFDRVATLLRDCEILTWADLLNKESAFKFYKIIVDTWQDTIVFDPKLKESKQYKSYINDIILHGSKYEFWREKFKNSASGKTLKKRIAEYNLISYDNGEGLFLKVLNQLILEAVNIPNVTSWLSCNNREFINNISEKEKGRKEHELINYREKESKELINSVTIRRCITCGRNISQQKNNSKFCSTKYVGSVQAKKCRNADSNKRNNTKRKMRVVKKLVVVQNDQKQRSVNRLRELLKKLNNNYSKSA